MNDEQRQIYEDLQDVLYGDPLQRVYNKTAFFIDAPGGTGKTFLCNALLSLVRGHGDIALACASSGIAATNLDEHVDKITKGAIERMQAHHMG